MAERIDDILIRLLARRYNMSEEEARSIAGPVLSDEKQVDKFKQLLSRIGDTAEVVSRIPPDARGIVTSVLMSSLMKNDDDFDSKKIEKMAERIALIKEAMRSLSDSDSRNNNSNSEFMAQLLKEIEELKRKLEEKEKEVEERKHLEVMNNLASAIAMLQRKIDQLEREVKERPVESGGGGDILDQLKRLKELESELTSLLGVSKSSASGNSKGIDEKTAVSLLKQKGYMIKEPPSWDEVMKAIQEAVESARNEARSEIEEQRFERQLQALENIVAKSIDRMMGEVFAPLVKSWVTNPSPNPKPQQVPVNPAPTSTPTSTSTPQAKPRIRLKPRGEE